MKEIIEEYFEGNTELKCTLMKTFPVSDSYVLEDIEVEKLNDRLIFYNNDFSFDIKNKDIESVRIAPSNGNNLGIRINEDLYYIICKKMPISVNFLPVV